MVFYTFYFLRKAPINVEQCRSSITTIQKGRKISGEFKESCFNCIELDRTGVYSGCNIHRIQPKLRRTGNPSRSLKSTNWIKNFMNQNKGYFGFDSINPDITVVTNNGCVEGHFYF